MKHSRIRWTAVALFAAAMTVAEVVALQAAARDARKWLTSDSAREIRQAGRAVAEVVTGSDPVSYGESSVVLVKGGNSKALRVVLAEAKACLKEARRTRETKWSWSSDEI